MAVQVKPKNPGTQVVYPNRAGSPITRVLIAAAIKASRAFPNLCLDASIQRLTENGGLTFMATPSICFPWKPTPKMGILKTTHANVRSRNKHLVLTWSTQNRGEKKRLHPFMTGKVSYLNPCSYRSPGKKNYFQYVVKSIPFRANRGNQTYKCRPLSNKPLAVH